jgi:hypothetical protein
MRSEECCVYCVLRFLLVFFPFVLFFALVLCLVARVSCVCVYSECLGVQKTLEERFGLGLYQLKKKTIAPRQTSLRDVLRRVLCAVRAVLFGCVFPFRAVPRACSLSRGLSVLCVRV